MNNPRKQNIDGILLLDKPYGISSNKAIQIARYIFSATKCGHTGTLDPLATGLLPICFGEATKFSAKLLNANKTYEARLQLGFLSTTGDAEGEIYATTTTTPKPLVWSECRRVLQQFIGHIKQLPPMYSALKHRGKPLYVYARNGETVAREARDIVIHELQIKAVIGNELHLMIRCSTGTYIRTLAEDIGKALGYGGAYLTALRRTAIDRFDLNQTKTLIELETTNIHERRQYLLPVDSFIIDLPAITLNPVAAQHVIQGRAVPYPLFGEITTESRLIRLYDDAQQFLGLGAITAERTIIAKRLLSNASLSQYLLD